MSNKRRSNFTATTAGTTSLTINKKGTPVYSREDIREQYCINDKELFALEASRRKPIFGCLTSVNTQPSPCKKKQLIPSCLRADVQSDECSYSRNRQLQESPRKKPIDYEDESYFKRRPKTICHTDPKILASLDDNLVRKIQNESFESRQKSDHQICNFKSEKFPASVNSPPASSQGLAVQKTSFTQPNTPDVMHSDKFKPTTSEEKIMDEQNKINYNKHMSRSITAGMSDGTNIDPMMKVDKTSIDANKEPIPVTRKFPGSEKPPAGCNAIPMDRKAILEDRIAYHKIQKGRKPTKRLRVDNKYIIMTNRKYNKCTKNKYGNNLAVKVNMDHAHKHTSCYICFRNKAHSNLAREFKMSLDTDEELDSTLIKNRKVYRSTAILSMKEKEVTILSNLDHHSPDDYSNISSLPSVSQFNEFSLVENDSFSNIDSSNSNSNTHEAMSVLPTDEDCSLASFGDLWITNTTDKNSDSFKCQVHGTGNAPLVPFKNERKLTSTQCPRQEIQNQIRCLSKDQILEKESMQSLISKISFHRELALSTLSSMKDYSNNNDSHKNKFHSDEEKTIKRFQEIDEKVSSLYMRGAANQNSIKKVDLAKEPRRVKLIDYDIPGNNPQRSIMRSGTSSSIGSSASYKRKIAKRKLMIEQGTQTSFDCNMKFNEVDRHRSRSGMYNKDDHQIASNHNSTKYNAIKEAKQKKEVTINEMLTIHRQTSIKNRIKAKFSNKNKDTKSKIESGQIYDSYVCRKMNSSGQIKRENSIASSIKYVANKIRNKKGSKKESSIKSNSSSAEKISLSTDDVPFSSKYSPSKIVREVKLTDELSGSDHKNIIPKLKSDSELFINKNRASLNIAVPKNKRKKKPKSGKYPSLSEDVIPTAELIKIPQSKPTFYLGDYNHNPHEQVYSNIPDALQYLNYQSPSTNNSHIIFPCDNMKEKSFKTFTKHEIKHNPSIIDISLSKAILLDDTNNCRKQDTAFNNRRRKFLEYKYNSKYFEDNNVDLVAINLRSMSIDDEQDIISAPYINKSYVNNDFLSSINFQNKLQNPPSERLKLNTDEHLMSFNITGDKHDTDKKSEVIKQINDNGTESSYKNCNTDIRKHLTKNINFYDNAVNKGFQRQRINEWNLTWPLNKESKILTHPYRDDKLNKTCNSMYHWPPGYTWDFSNISRAINHSSTLSTESTDVSCEKLDHIELEHMDIKFEISKEANSFGTEDDNFDNLLLDQHMEREDPTLSGDDQFSHSTEDLHRSAGENFTSPDLNSTIYPKDSSEDSHMDNTIPINKFSWYEDDIDESNSSSEGNGSPDEVKTLQKSLTDIESSPNVTHGKEANSFLEYEIEKKLEESNEFKEVIHESLGGINDESASDNKIQISECEKNMGGTEHLTKTFPSDSYGRSHTLGKAELKPSSFENMSSKEIPEILMHEGDKCSSVQQAQIESEHVNCYNSSEKEENSNYEIEDIICSSHKNDSSDKIFIKTCSQVGTSTPIFTKEKTEHYKIKSRPQIVRQNAIQSTNSNDSVYSHSYPNTYYENHDRHNWNFRRKHRPSRSPNLHDVDSPKGNHECSNQTPFHNNYYQANKTTPPEIVKIKKKRRRRRPRPSIRRKNIASGDHIKSADIAETSTNKIVKKVDAHSSSDHGNITDNSQNIYFPSQDKLVNESTKTIMGKPEKSKTFTQLEKDIVNMSLQKSISSSEDSESEYAMFKFVANQTERNFSRSPDTDEKPKDTAC